MIYLIFALWFGIATGVVGKIKGSSAILWFLIGKGPAGAVPSRGQVAPDDDLEFLHDLGRQEEQDERIRRLEQELADLDDDPPADK